MLRRALCRGDAGDYDAVVQGGMAHPGAVFAVRGFEQETLCAYAIAFPC
jgi:hypothetical protein